MFQVINRMSSNSRLEKVLVVSKNKQAFVRFIGKSFVQHHVRSTVTMTHEEVSYLTGTSMDPKSARKEYSDLINYFAIQQVQ